MASPAAVADSVNSGTSWTWHCRSVAPWSTTGERLCGFAQRTVCTTSGGGSAGSPLIASREKSAGFVLRFFTILRIAQTTAAMAVDERSVRAQVGRMAAPTERAKAYRELFEERAAIREYDGGLTRLGGNQSVGGDAAG